MLQDPLGAKSYVNKNNHQRIKGTALMVGMNFILRFQFSKFLYARFKLKFLDLLSDTYSRIKIAKRNSSKIFMRKLVSRH